MHRLLPLATAVMVGCAVAAGWTITETSSRPLPQAAHRATNPHNSLKPAPAHQTGAPAPPPGEQATAATVQRTVQSMVPGAQVGLDVVDRQTGTVLTSTSANQQFPAMSVVKLLIALDSLYDDGNNSWIAPDGTAQERIRQSLSNSDDATADALWSADGGPAIVTRVAHRLGLTGTQPPDDPNEWGDVLTTPDDMVTVYRYITDQVPNLDRDLLLGALSNTPKYAADGFDQYFGIPDGLPQATWAIKQGWGTSGNQAVFNTTGLVGPGERFVVVLMTSSSADSYDAAPRAVTAGTSVLAELVGTARR